MKRFGFALVIAIVLGIVLLGPSQTAPGVAQGEPAAPNAASTLGNCGAAWKVVPSSNVGTKWNYLWDVTAVSANDVWSVGYYQNNGGPYQTLIEHWDGTNWSIVPSPNKAGDNQLRGVAAVSANDIWAVGYGGGGTLIEHWNGTNWSIVPNPNVGSLLKGVAAVSANDVWAVGYAGNPANGVSQTLIEHWNGTSWSVVPSLNPGPGRNELYGVAAASANDVWAVGFYYDGGAYRTLIEHWNGTNWSVVPSPNLSTSDSLGDVVAGSANDVWAVGDSYTGTLIEHWNGTSWSIVTSPNPGTYNFLIGVAAVSANDVWAVGYADAQTLIEYWNGTSWSVVPSPNPGESNSLWGVVAVSANDIWAVGLNAYQTLIERYTCPGFTVTAIEVTQAIQDLDNSVPLVAGKRTFARVHVRNQGTPSSALVTARLCGPGRCLAPDNPGKRIQVLANPDRARLDQSFYFELPPEWLNGNVTLTAEVNPAGPQHVEESNTANNSLSRSVTFEAVPPLKVKLFGVQYRFPPYVWEVHEPRPEDYGLIVSWLRRAYPTAEIQWSKDVLDYGVGLPTCGEVNARLWANWAFDRIENKIDGHTRYYGVVSDSGYIIPAAMRGCAMAVPSSIASGPAGTPSGSWAWDKDASYGDWYAGHELAHTYGRLGANFCSSTEPSVPYPYPDGLIGGPIADTTRYYGFDIEARAVYTPTGWHDVMTYCPYQWISDVTYKGLRDYLVAQGALAAQKIASVGEYLIVIGAANRTQNTAELHTLYRIPDVTAPAPPISGTHRLKLLGAGDAVLADYPFTPGKDTSTEPGEDEIGLIGEIVPWVTGTQRVAVYSGTLELASRLVSTNTPTVTVLSPNGGEVFTDTAVVSWSAGDADQDPLTYVLQYSIDDGATWQAVSVGITSTTVYTLDLTLLPGTDQGRVRVIASDGVNTGMDTSDGAFRVARKPPQARILSSALGSSFLFGQTVILVGEGTDAEDGVLADLALSWQSSLSGTLGTGRMLAVTGLITGTHVITLTATDSDGNTATTTVQVLVTFPEDVVPDCQVDVVDIQAVASRWRLNAANPDPDNNPTTPNYEIRFDLDGDGDVDIVDIMRVAARWGDTCGGGAASVAPSPGRSGVEASTQNPTVRLGPADSTVAVGSTFTVTVMIDEAVDLGAFQFDLRYSPASVQVEAVTLGGFLASTGRTAASAGPQIDNGTGFASFAGFSFGTQAGPNGSGTLALVRLRAVGAGTSPLDLDKVQVIDTLVNSQVPRVDDGSVTVKERTERKIHLPIIMKNYYGQP